MGKTKITAKIHAGLLRSFDKQVDGLFLKRDAFLNHMIRGETPNLAEDLAGRRQSKRAKRYIAGKLKRLGTQQISIEVDRDTAKALKAVVEASNLVRDAFVNRLILFLSASDALLGSLDLPRKIEKPGFESYVEPMPTSPMEAMESVYGDPLFYLRVAIEERYKCGLYALELPGKLAAFSCHLEDHSVPGTDEYAEARKEALEAEAQLADLLRVESPPCQYEVRHRPSGI